MASKINAKTTGTGGIEYTADASGEIELQSDGVTKAKVTANGLQDANGASLRGGSFRNLVINGNMSIAQRGTSTAGITGSGYFTVDRWYLQITSLGTWTQTQDSSVPSGQGFTKSLKFACTTADASPSASDFFILQQRLEGQNLQQLKKGTANSESVTLSFWVKSNKTGTYQFNLRDQDNTRHIGSTYTIDTADTWEKKTLTFDGDTTGALDNDNNNSLQLEWWFGSGSTFSSGSVPTSWEASDNADRNAGGTVNLADSTSNYINITGVQLEVGEGASDFEFLPVDVQLRRCQRYFYKGFVSCVAISSNGTIPNRTYPVYLRSGGSFSISYGGVANRVYRTIDAGLKDLVSPVMNGDVESFHTLYAFTPSNWALSAGGINFNLEVNAEL